MQLISNDDGRDAGEVLLDVQNDLRGLSDVLLALKASRLEVEPWTIDFLRHALAATAADVERLARVLEP